MRELFYKETWIDLYDKLSHWVITELPSLLILVVSIFLILRLLSFLISKIKKLILKKIRRDDPIKEEEAEKRAITLLGIVKGIIKVLVWSIFILMFLGKFGVNLGPILAGAGIVGLAVGFGSQELVRDFIAGFFILLENQIRRGDIVIINGTGGEVESIELRTTTLRDLSGVVHIFQNGKINTISNMTKEWAFSLMEVGVAYKENYDRVVEIMQKTFDTLNDDADFTRSILGPLEILGLDRFADSAVIIKARIKTTPGDQWRVGRGYRKYLKVNFDNENIEIPFPHVTLYMGAGKDDTKIPEVKE